MRDNSLVVTTPPRDSRFLPANLAVADIFDQPHPVFCLWRRDVPNSLTEFLAGGGRKIDHCLATLKVVKVAFDEEAEAFENINNHEELGHLESALGDA